MFSWSVPVTLVSETAVGASFEGDVGVAIRPGEPISAASPAAVKAPLLPTELSVETVTPSAPAPLSKDGNGPLGDEPKLMRPDARPRR